MLVSVWVGTWKNMEIKLIDKVIFVVVEQAVNYVSGHGRRNPFAGMDSSLDPDVGLALSGFGDLKDFHVSAFVGLPDVDHLDEVELLLHFVQIGV